MKKNKRIKQSNSTFSSKTGKEDNKIVPIKEKVQKIALSSSTIQNLDNKPLKGPNALTMTQTLTNHDNIKKGNKKKLGDGSFIAAEDR
jgi:small-conductance mechanosensitive channel